MSIQQDLGRWFASGERGVSSETMALWLGFREKNNKRWSWGNHPHDPDDFDRCLKLLRDVPGLREILPRMAEVSPVWAALVKRWDEIERCHLDEVGLGWTKARSAPKTYDLMRSVIDGAEKAR